MTNYCGSCGLRNPQKNVCALNNRTIDPAADYCSKHTTAITRCNYCGHITMSPIVDTTTQHLHIYCQRCFDLLDTCATCEQSNYCAFEQDPSPIPHMVMKQVRQGNMTMTTQIPNPDRVAITCKVRCNCFNEEIGCRKQNDNWCDKYKQIEVHNAN